MSRGLFALLLVLAASATQAREPEQVLVPEGEAAEHVQRADWLSSEKVTALALSPNGRLLATGTPNGSILVWDLATGRVTLRFEEGVQVSALLFGSDSHTLLTASRDGIVRQWDLSTRQEVLSRIQTVPGQAPLAFSPDGRLIALGRTFGKVLLRDWATGGESSLQTPDGTQTMAFSPDGRLVASAGDDEAVRLWEVATGRELRQLRDHRDSILSVAFSPDGLTLAAAGSDAIVRVWDVNTGRELRRLEGHTGSVRALAFSPDGHILASGSQDRTVRLWAVATGRDLRRLEGHASSVNHVAFGADGRTLTSAGDDETVRRWDIATGRDIQTLQGMRPQHWALAFSPDSQTLALGGRTGAVWLWDVNSGRHVRRLESDESGIYTLAFSPRGNTLAVGGVGGLLRLRDVDTGRELFRVKAHERYLSRTAFNATGEALLTTGDDWRAMLWTVRTDDAGDLSEVVPNTDLNQKLSRSRSTTTLAFNPANGLIALGHYTQHVSLWDMAQQRQVRQWTVGRGTMVQDLQFSGDGRTLAALEGDSKIRLWDVATGLEHPPARFPPGEQSIRSMALSPTGRTVAAGDANGTVWLWDVATGKQRLTLKGVNIHPYAANGTVDPSVQDLTFSPGGDLLAASNGLGVVQLWDPESGQQMGYMVAGEQTWLSQLRNRPVFRLDTGRFLSLQPEFGRFIPLLPPQPEAPPRLSVEASLVSAPEDFGKPGELALTITNAADAGRAYWVRVQALALPPGLRLLPPEPLAYLEAGDSVSIRVGLSYLRPDGAPPPDARFEAGLQLVHAFGDGPSVTLPVRVNTPELVLRQAPLLEDKLLTVVLKNTGTQSTGPLVLRATFGPPAATPTQESGASGPKEQTLVLEPGQEERIPFALPEGLPHPDRFSFQLTASYERWPRTWSQWTPEVRAAIPYGLYGGAVLVALAVLWGVYFMRVHRHPLVLQAVEKPKALRTYSLSKLERTDTALRRAGRLEDTLSAADIPTQRWERMLRATRGPLEAATAFGEAIGGRLGAGLGAHAWALELPPLRLRFTRQTAVLVLDGAQLESGEARRRLLDIYQDGRGPAQVLVLDRTQAQNAGAVLRDVPQVRGVVLGLDSLGELLLAYVPTQRLESIIAQQVAVSELSPYQVAAGVKDDQLFFGRERELRAILDRALRNFFVVGQRQMGKSSLLLAVQRGLRERRDVEVHYLTLADEDLHERLAREQKALVPGQPRPSFLELAAGTKERPRVWLLDEADSFIQADAQAKYPVVQAMRALSQEGRAYFVLAGFWDLYRAVVLDERQPLRNFGEYVRLEPLDERAALQLVTEPLAALNLPWDAPGTPEDLLRQAGRRANLLVLACKGLVETLPPEAHELTREHLERVLRGDEDLRKQCRGWRGDQPLHKAVVRQALLLGQPTREQVLQALKERGAVIAAADFDEAMDHRELSYVLVPDEAGRLYCPVPLMQHYIESERGLEAGLTEDLEDLREGFSKVPTPA